jgi:hypothetical protein
MMPRVVGGGGGVPASGSWPLGVGVPLEEVQPSDPLAAAAVAVGGVVDSGVRLVPVTANVVDVDLGTVDDFEARRAEEMDARMLALPKKDRRAATGETRQFSHRAGVRPRLRVTARGLCRCWRCCRVCRFCRLCRCW